MISHQFACLFHSCRPVVNLLLFGLDPQCINSYQFRLAYFSLRAWWASFPCVYLYIVFVFVFDALAVQRRAGKDCVAIQSKCWMPLQWLQLRWAFTPGLPMPHVLSYANMSSFLGSKEEWREARAYQTLPQSKVNRGCSDVQ